MKMTTYFKTALNSYAFIGFFTIFGYWLFFNRNKNKVKPKLSDVKTINSSLTDIQAESYADSCYSSFNYVLGFDDVETLNRILLPLDNDSFNHVYKKFGLKQERTLVQWLVEQLNEEELTPFMKFDLIS